MNSTSNITNAVNNYYDQLLLHRATSELLHGMFAQKRPLPRNGSTNTIKFRRYSNLSTATTPLVEGQNPGSVQFSIADVTAQVQEYGNYVEVSSTLDWSVVSSEPAEWMQILGYNANDTLDVLMRDAYNAGTNVYYGGNATLTSNVDTADLIDATAIKKSVRLLKNNDARVITSFGYTDDATDVKNIRPCFVGICHPNTTYTLKGLTGWTDIEQYAHSTQTMPGEVGKLDEVRFIETTNAKIKAGEGNGGIDVYTTLIFAQDAVGRTMVTGEDLKTIYHPFGSAGASDPLNRISTMGWTTTFVAMILNNAYLVRIEHAVAA